MDYISAIQGDPLQWVNFARHMRRFFVGAPTAQEFFLKMEGHGAGQEVKRAVWCAGVPYPSMDMIKAFWGQEFGGLSHRGFVLAKHGQVAVRPPKSSSPAAVMPELVRGVSTALAYWVEDTSNQGQ